MWEAAAVSIVNVQALKKNIEADKLHNQELELRKNNPSVKCAWEQYQIMLKLSR